MQIINDLNLLPELPHGSAVTIGNFDGVHLAHQRLLTCTVKMARAFGAPAVALTFEPHPARVLAPQRAPRILTPLSTKAKWIEQVGVDILVALAFTEELSRESPADFVHRIIAGRLRARGLCVGSNFHFGHRQAGSPETLAALSGVEGFTLKVVPTLRIRGQAVSSSRIRQLLSEGRVHMAGRLLGRPFSNSGPVVTGLGIGHREAAPTLNLNPIEEQLPATGVYVSRTVLDGAVCPSVTNVGCKPTFGEHPVTVETHLLKLERPVRQQEIAVEYLHRLRDEIKFPNAAALKAQIQKDVRRSQKLFRLFDRVRGGAPSRSVSQL